MAVDDGGKKVPLSPKKDRRLSQGPRGKREIDITRRALSRGARLRPLTSKKRGGLYGGRLPENKSVALVGGLTSPEGREILPISFSLGRRRKKKEPKKDRKKNRSTWKEIRVESNRSEGGGVSWRRGVKGRENLVRKERGALPRGPSKEEIVLWKKQKKSEAQHILRRGATSPRSEEGGDAARVRG